MASFSNRQVSLAKRLFSGILAAVSMTVFAVQPVIALSYDYDPLDVPMYAPESLTCGPSSVPAGTSNSNKKVVFIGDSLMMNMSRAGLLTMAKTAGFDVNTQKTESADNSLGIASTRVQGPSIEATNGINITSSLPRIAAPALEVFQSGAIVIGLGTNQEPDLQQKVSSFIDEVKRVNPNNPKIYWINTHFTAASSYPYTDRNIAIAAAAADKGITVIDWASEVSKNPSLYPYDADGIHLTVTPEVDGNKNRNSFILTSIGGQATDAPAQGVSVTNTYDPLSLTYPAFPDEQSLISSLEDHITKQYPRSPFAKNLQYVRSIFSQSKQLDINPLLVISIAQQENGYGQANSKATENNNFFGITQGSGYREFTSVEESIDYFLRKIEEHVKTPAGNYLNVRSFYEYLAVHQSGVLAYPGEYPAGSQGANAVPPYLSRDPRMKGVAISWDTTANANTPEPYTNKTYNPLIYFENSVALINKITGLSLSNVPSKTGSTAVAGGGTACPPSGTATLSGNAPGSKTYKVDGFTIYKQDDPVWGKNPYGVGINGNGDERTIASSGCGPAAMAMIITALTGTAVTPAETAAFGMQPATATYSTGGGSDGVPLAEKMAANWGLKAKHIGPNEQAINETLQNGGLVIVSGQGGLPFSTGGHFVVIRGVTAEGKWLVGDSSHDSAKPDTSTVAYEPSVMINDFTAGGYSSYAITR